MDSSFPSERTLYSFENKTEIISPANIIGEVE